MSAFPKDALSFHLLLKVLHYSVRGKVRYDVFLPRFTFSLFIFTFYFSHISYLQQLCAEGEGDGLRAVGDVKLSAQGVDVFLDHRQTDAEELGDFCV